MEFNTHKHRRDDVRELISHEELIQHSQSIVKMHTAQISKAQQFKMYLSLLHAVANSPDDRVLILCPPGSDVASISAQLKHDLDPGSTNTHPRGLICDLGFITLTDNYSFQFVDTDKIPADAPVCIGQFDNWYDVIKDGKFTKVIIVRNTLMLAIKNLARQVRAEKGVNIFDRLLRVFRRMTSDDFFVAMRRVALAIRSMNNVPVEEYVFEVSFIELFANHKPQL